MGQHKCHKCHNGKVDRFGGRQGSRVLPDRLPDWLRPRLQIIPEFKSTVDDATYFKRIKQYLGLDWADNWGTTRFQGKDCFVCEPSEYSGSDLKEAAEFGLMLDADLVVTANSWTRPGHSIRMLFVPQPSDWGTGKHIHRLHPLQARLGPDGLLHGVCTVCGLPKHQIPEPESLNHLPTLILRCKRCINDYIRNGRNRPCLCGSGKKFKNCCLPRGQELAAARMRV